MGWQVDSVQRSVQSNGSDPSSPRLSSSSSASSSLANVPSSLFFGSCSSNFVYLQAYDLMFLPDVHRGGDGGFLTLRANSLVVSLVALS
ncbi:hypothetical protein SDJN03_25037, partial [Cucurbita argyrosperma subsp. sororia]